MNKRFLSVVIDHLIMSVIAICISAPAIIFESEASNLLSEVLISVAFTMYFNKDVFYGRSIAKRILNLYVCDYKTNHIASPFKCFVRNLFGIIWFIDVIFLFTNGGRRLGDIVCNTVVREYTNEKVSHNNINIIFTLVLSFTMILLFSHFFLSVTN